MHVYKVTCPLLNIPNSFKSIFRINSVIVQCYTKARLWWFLPLQKDILIFYYNKIKYFNPKNKYTNLDPDEDDDSVSFLFELFLSGLYLPVFWRYIFITIKYELLKLTIHIHIQRCSKYFNWVWEIETLNKRSTSNLCQQLFDSLLSYFRAKFASNLLYNSRACYRYHLPITFIKYR